MSEQNTITIIGANGRMGRMLVQSIHARSDSYLQGAVGKKGADYIGKDAGEVAGIGAIGVAITDDPHEAIANSMAVIDFTPPPHFHPYAELAAQAHAVYVCGSTGLQDADWQVLEKAAQHTAVIYGSNMSKGINVLMDVVRRVAAKLGDEYDIEITDLHHRYKKDAPSGTALSLGLAAAKGRGINHDDNIEAGRHGIGEARQKGAIGYAVSRAGSVIGEHQVIFASDKERLEFGHRSADRSLFADGAITAALWGKGKDSGLYSMADVLDL